MDSHPYRQANVRQVNAADHNLALCLACHTLTPCNPDESVSCQRCGNTVYQRKPQSLERAWALLFAAIITLIPANTLPIMTILLFGHGQPSTIMGGIMILIDYKMYPIAAVVFIASFMVPLLKIAGLASILITLQKKSRLTAMQCTRLYRLVEFFGRWSMLDVFVVMLMVATVQLGSLAEVIAGAGAATFGASVILTMLAAHSFDPRLIWDHYHRQQKITDES
jgi:paraquat-inducible protein A